MERSPEISSNKRQWIEITGASQNNLKNISLKIPKKSLTVITGISGSGKSSLAFEVMHGEGRRNYFGNLSAHARKYLGKLEKPRVEKIRGLNPTIAISQDPPRDNPRSTVGTITGVYDSLRLLFARVGRGGGENVVLTRSMFSFNSPEGACSQCRGLGVVDSVDPDLLIADESKTIREGAFKITNPKGYIIYSQVTIDALDQVLQAHGANVDTPWRKLSPAQQDVVLNGSDIIKIPYGKHTLESRMKWSGITAKPREEGVYKGILPVMNGILKQDRNRNILRYAKTIHCPDCRGTRLKSGVQAVHVHGYTIIDLCNMSLMELSGTLAEFTFQGIEQAVASVIVGQVQKRLAMLSSLGLSYLTLSRLAGGLSGGEMQRIRLARQVLSGLRNITYVLDEPTAGVHPENCLQVTKLLRKLVSLDNTVVAVAHDAITMGKAHWIIEIGPGAGEGGGEVLFAGTMKEFFSSSHPSPTRDYLEGKGGLSLEESGETEPHKPISVAGAAINNLQSINVRFCRNRFNVVTGVSGAGKSSLVNQTLIPLLAGNYQQQLHAKGTPSLTGAAFKKTIVVDRRPIGKTARSNPATYTGLYDLIRALYAELPESKERGFNRGTFSFNVKGGSCNTCQGAGTIVTGMHFLGNVSRPCDNCGGKRFAPPVLGVTWKGKSIADVLDLTVDEASQLFMGKKKIDYHLSMLVNLGLGYLKLGQPSGTLSGGEAQRIRLARELIKGTAQNVLCILEEPTVGLHSHDIKKLFLLFDQLLDNGNTLILIEHNQEVIRSAHHIVELGPGSGAAGGEVVYQGDLSGLLGCAQSKTSRMLLEKRVPSLGAEINPTGLVETALYGVTTHNLKSIDVIIPDQALTVIVGKSGSGKTSLAFDTLCAEAQSRYMESFPAKVVTSRYSQASYQQVKGLCPVVALGQYDRVRDPRSTLGTVSGMLDLFRLMFSRYGTCGEGAKLPSAGHFSFNNIIGACSHCSGLGTTLTGSFESLFERKDLPMSLEACGNRKAFKLYMDPDGRHLATLRVVGRQLGFDYGVPIKELSAEACQVALFGTGEVEYEVSWKYKRGTRKGRHVFKGPWQGLVPLVRDEYQRKHARGKGEDLRALLIEKKCSVCGGGRLKPEILAVKFGDMNLAQWLSMDVRESLRLLGQVKSGVYTSGIPRAFDLDQNQLLESLISKLSVIAKLGLEYLALDRSCTSLSGGEMQRVLLANLEGGGLTGVTYILDEPSIGLHGADIQGLISSIHELTTLGNTVVCVEHNLEIIRAADHLIELGPSGGEAGGRVIGQGQVADIADSPDSLIGKWLNKPLQLRQPSPMVPSDSVGDVSFFEAACHNLKNISFRLQRNRLNLITGVSGSGKTTLLREVIYPSFVSGRPVNCKWIKGLSERVNAVWVGREGRIGNVASASVTFLGLFDYIRKVFANLPVSKSRCFSPSHFSFNNRLGQCPVCKGAGEERVKLDFLSDVSSPCESCGGSRYRDEILSATYQGFSIDQVLKLTFSAAVSLFDDFPKIREKLDLVIRLGLGYLTLGQGTHTLSGGEAQRLMLIRDILAGGGENTVYLFDEPGKGLHMEDLKNLYTLFEMLFERGSTLVVIDHNPHLIARADWVIDLGPGAGEKGGELVYQGGVAGLLERSSSVTGAYMNGWA